MYEWCVLLYVNVEYTLPSDFSTTNITATYKGFYIARYEASNTSDKIDSKKATSDIGLTYTSAKVNSENMAINNNYDTTKIGTNLVTGTQWYTVMK